MFSELHLLRFNEACLQVHRSHSTSGLPCAGAKGLLSAAACSGSWVCTGVVGAEGLGSRVMHWQPRLQSTSHTLLKATRAPVKFTLSGH